jgi:hypothetical protein
LESVDKVVELLHKQVTQEVQVVADKAAGEPLQGLRADRASQAETVELVEWEHSSFQ